MQFYISYIGLINGIISLIIGFFILAKDYGKKSNRYFFGLSVLSAIYGISFWLWLSQSTGQAALIWIKLFLIALIVQPIVYLRLISKILNLRTNRAQIIFSLASIYYILLILIDLFAGNLGSISEFSYWPSFKLTFAVFVSTHAVGLTAYIYYLLAENYFNELNLSKLQTRYLLVATLLAFLGWYSHLFLWFNIAVLPFGNLFSCLYLVILAYLLAKERLMDLRLIMSKIYVYSVLLFIVYLFYWAFYFVDTSVRAHDQLITIAARIVFALLFLMFFLPFIRIVQKTGDYLFFKGYNPENIIKDVLIKFTSVIDVNELLDVLAVEFNKAIGTNRVGFLIFDIGKNDEVAGFKYNPSINLSFLFHPSERLLNKIRSEKKIIIRSELDEGDADIAKEMDFHHVNNISPLIFKDSVIGLMVINDKVSGESFTQEEIEFIEVIGKQASVAIVNAMLHKEVEDLNEQLKARYKSQTSALKEQSEDLQEFFKISSFKVKEQLSAIKEILKGEIAKSKKTKTMLSEPYLKVLKTADIINDIIKASEMGAGGFELSFEKVDLNKILRQVYNDRLTAAKLKNLKFKLVMPEKPPPKILGNSEYLEQVITSLVNNAIRYTEKGAVELSLGFDSSNITIRVKDSGIGIRKKDADALFQRFKRGSNAVAAHPDGSGLGLFIAKKIIDAHQGASIYLEESALNKGAVFAVSFKI